MVIRVTRAIEVSLYRLGVKVSAILNFTPLCSLMVYTGPSGDTV